MALLGYGQLYAGGLMLPSILSDHMMLRRAKPARIWGKGGEGETVTVHFKNQPKTMVVNDGQWSLALDPEPEGGPYEMQIDAGADKKVIENILVGEVWL